MRQSVNKCGKNIFNDSQLHPGSKLALDLGTNWQKSDQQPAFKLHSASLSGICLGTFVVKPQAWLGYRYFTKLPSLPQQQSPKTMIGIGDVTSVSRGLESLAGNPGFDLWHYKSQQKHDQKILGYMLAGDPQPSQGRPGHLLDYLISSKAFFPLCF